MKRGAKFILMPFCFAGILAAMSLALMLLWNALLPDILHVSSINYWQAMGIFVLSKILFGFGGPRGGGGAPWMRKKRMMEEKFRNMSPDERMRFKEQWKDRCGWGRRRGEWAKDFTEQAAPETHDHKAE